MTVSISLLTFFDPSSPARRMFGMLCTSESNVGSSLVKMRLVVKNFNLCSSRPDARLDA